MVGWIPQDMSLRQKKCATLIARVKKSQEFGWDEVPVVLQYDYTSGDLRPWIWPEVDGIPVRPDELDRHRYSHYFKAPCCLCTFIRGDDRFCEAKVGLAQTVNQPATAHCLGRYVAICPTQECGYFVNMESYFSHPNLMTGEYTERKEPVKLMDPFLFLTGDTEETIKKTGLRQIRVLQDNSNTGLRGTNKFLRREDPKNFSKLEGSLKSLLVNGLPAERFWDLFVQCTDCQHVMPRQYFPYYHPCMVQAAHPQLGPTLLQGLPTPRIPELLRSDIDLELVPVELSSDDSIIGLPILEACAALTRRRLGATLAAEPTTPKGRPVPV